MNLVRNAVIVWPSDESRVHAERVLFIDLSGTHMVTIDIDPENNKALLVWRKCEEVSIALATGDTRILDTDPYVLPAQTLSDEIRKHRDELWEIIKPLIEGDDKEGWTKEDIFIPQKRGPMIAKVSENTKRAKRLIYTYLRRYWQGGQIKNALIPHYHKSGGKGKERQVKDRKRGCPREATHEAQTSIGVNVTPEIRKVFQRGIRLFYENQDGRTLREAWQLTKEQFFHKGFELKNGVLVPLLPPADELPTFEQFRYWYE